MKDPSGNEKTNKIKILQDISVNFIINPLFLDLQDCSKNKINNDDNTLVKDIKNNKNTFNMKLNRILNSIKKERETRKDNCYNTMME